MLPSSVRMDVLKSIVNMRGRCSSKSTGNCAIAMWSIFKNKSRIPLQSKVALRTTSTTNDNSQVSQLSYVWKAFVCSPYIARFLIKQCIYILKLFAIATSSECIFAIMVFIMTFLEVLTNCSHWQINIDCNYQRKFSWETSELRRFKNAVTAQ